MRLNTQNVTKYVQIYGNVGYTVNARLSEQAQRLMSEYLVIAVCGTKDDLIVSGVTTGYEFTKPDTRQSHVRNHAKSFKKNSPRRQFS